MLSKKAKYSIRALLYLARHRGEGPVLIRDIAESESIPHKFLETILLELKNVGILQSKLGKGGGYFLERSPDTIPLGRIIRMTEGPLAPVSCVSQTAYAPCEECDDERTCVIRFIMKQVRDAKSKILDEATLETMLQQEKKSAEANYVVDFTI